MWFIQIFSYKGSSNKQSINEVIRAATTGPEKPFEVSFNVDIESASSALKSRTRFAVHHRVASHPADEKLRDWSKAQAMIPWVAVAAPISVRLWHKNAGNYSKILIGRCSSHGKWFAFYSSTSANPDESDGLYTWPL